MSGPRGPQPLGLGDLQEWARSRGGECLATEFLGPEVPHGWRCALGHTFEARPKTLMEGGHWCETCQPGLDAPGLWDWEAIAQGDPTLAHFHQAESEIPDDPVE